MATDRRRRFARAWLAGLGRSVGRCDARWSARFYVGRRDVCAQAYVVTRDDVAPLVHRAFRGDTPFDWGTHGAGATELSFSLLCDAMHRRASDAVVFELGADLIADLPGDGFVLSVDDLYRWLAHRARGLNETPLAAAMRRDRWLRALALAQPWPAYPFLVPTLDHRRRTEADAADDDAS
jgi:hypothetical protein